MATPRSLAQKRLRDGRGAMPDRGPAGLSTTCHPHPPSCSLRE